MSKALTGANTTAISAVMLFAPLRNLKRARLKIASEISNNFPHERLLHPWCPVSYGAPHHLFTALGRTNK